MKELESAVEEKMNEISRLQDELRILNSDSEFVHVILMIIT